MSTEVEAKFIVPDRSAVQRIRDLPRLGSYDLGEPTERPVQDDYLDTSSLSLLAAGWACRRRRQPDGCLVTAKSVRSAKVDVHQREELEALLPPGDCAAADPAPNAWPPSSVRDKVTGISGDQPLHVLFSLRQDRLLRDVLDRRGRVAVASLDEVSLATGSGSDRWWELEVELLDGGTETDLAAMMGWIQATLGLHLATESKFERALKAVLGAAHSNPRLRRASRRKPADERSSVLEAPPDGPSGSSTAPGGAGQVALPLADLEARGYSSHLRRHAEDEIVFHDTHDGAFMKKGYVLSWSRSHGTWRLREDGRVQAEEAGPRDAVPLEGAIGALLGTIPAEHPTIPLLEASLEQSDYFVRGVGTDPLRIQARWWTFRSPLVPGAPPAHRAPPTPGAPLVSGTPLTLGAPRSLLRLSVRGPSAGVAYFSALLQDQLGFRPSLETVLERGLALLGISAPGSPPPKDLRVEAGDSVASAFRKIVRAEAWKMRMNARGAVLDLHPEFVHDLRVATRRARSAGRLFTSVTEPGAAALLREELRWIARLLGEVRDLDVLSSRIDAQLALAGAAAGFSTGVRSAIAARRASARGYLVPALESERFSKLIGSLESAADACGPAGEQPVAGFARKRIDKAFRKLAPWIERPAETLGDAELHRIRILFKRLRYACEFFRPLYGGAAETLIGSFVSFQDCLGLHQDAAAAARVLTEVLQQAPASDRTENFLLSMGSLIQVQRNIQQEQRQKFLRLWESASQLPATWKKVRAQAGTPA